jgi:predicted nucleic acid-binding protein
MEQEDLPGDATTLIYLAKADGFDIAARCVRGILVPPSVWREAVEAGERRGYPDVARIRVAERAGFLRRIALHDAAEALSATIAGQHRLGLGESEVLALAHETMRAIVDDGRAARVAEALGIRPLSTLFLPVFGRQGGSLGEDEALAYVRRLAVAANARAEAVFVIEQFIRGVR